MAVRTIEEAIDRFSELARQYNCGHYHVMIEKRNGKFKRAIATCNNLFRVFTFTEYYALNLIDEHFDMIAKHEIAHALTPGHGHDTYFKRKCLEIGAIEVASTNFDYLSSELPEHLQVNRMQRKYIYVCPNCGKESSSARRWKRTKSCGKCSPVFDERYVLKLKTA